MSRLADDLKDILSKPIDPTLFPQKVGNKINIGSFSIICHRDKHTVKSYKTNEIVAETYSKTAAIALVKSLSKRRNNTTQILDLDRIIMKNYIDCMFYKNTMNKSKDETKQWITQTRFDISWEKVNDAKKKLEQFIW